MQHLSRVRLERRGGESQTEEAAPQDVTCPHCKTSQPPERLGGGWYECPCCARTFRRESL